MKKQWLTAIVLGALVLGAGAECWAVSGAGAINLVFPIGARYSAMGEAGVALSQDATAMWWNPGGLAFLSDKGQRDIHIMQSNLAAGLADDIALYWGGYAAPWGSGGAFGVNINYLSMGEQEATNEGGDSRGTFNSYMFAFNVVYGARLSQNLGVGMGFKYFRDKLADDQFIQDGAGGSGDSFGVDFGVLYKIPAWRLNVAAAVANLGPNIKHVDEDQSDPMPRRFTVGIAKSIVSTEALSWLVVGDYLMPLLKWNEDKGDYGFGMDWRNDDGENEIGIGSEASYIQSLFFRIGYKRNRAGDIKGMTWGFGLDMTRWLGRPIAFDYASVPQATGLDSVNRLSLGFRF